MGVVLSPLMYKTGQLHARRKPVSWERRHSSTSKSADFASGACCASSIRPVAVLLLWAHTGRCKAKQCKGYSTEYVLQAREVHGGRCSRAHPSASPEGCPQHQHRRMGSCEVPHGSPGKACAKGASCLETAVHTHVWAVHADLHGLAGIHALAGSASGMCCLRWMQKRTL